MTGGNLRREFAAGLIEAAELLDEPRLAQEAARWQEVAVLWHRLAEAALPADVPSCAQARELTAAVSMAVAAGDNGREDRVESAEQLWAIRDRYAAAPPLDAEDVRAVLGEMSSTLSQIYEAEKAAVQCLGSVIHG